VKVSPPHLATPIYHSNTSYYLLEKLKQVTTMMASIKVFEQIPKKLSNNQYCINDLALTFDLAGNDIHDA
jgi:hypothetical protein